jgi:hypothetical protein
MTSISAWSAIRSYTGGEALYVAERDRGAG